MFSKSVQFRCFVDPLSRQLRMNTSGWHSWSVSFLFDFSKNLSFNDLLQFACRKMCNLVKSRSCRTRRQSRCRDVLFFVLYSTWGLFNQYSKSANQSLQGRLLCRWVMVKIGRIMEWMLRSFPPNGVQWKCIVISLRKLRRFCSFMWKFSCKKTEIIQRCYLSFGIVYQNSVV